MRLSCVFLSLNTLRLQPIEKTSWRIILSSVDWKGLFIFGRWTSVVRPPLLICTSDFRRTSPSRLLSMLHMFWVCFHLPISGMLPQGVPALTYRDKKISASKGVWMMNGPFSLSAHPFSYIVFGIGLCIPSLSSKSKCLIPKGPKSHLGHRGNLIGNGKLLFCCWENDVNVQQPRRARPWWDFEMWNLNNPLRLEQPTGKMYPWLFFNCISLFN